MPVATPHDWEDIARFLGAKPTPDAVLLELVAHLRHRGLDARLAPLYSHGSLTVLDRGGEPGRHLTVFPPSAGTVRVESHEGDGAETRLFRAADVPVEDAITAFESLLPWLLGDLR